ncbi:hypothetical protein HW555_001744 [Spodoptera exigua]|uniref:G-protein coupled receptors family 3 profile domain-containing protein n=1 Tax=Spodoptera exigua TaxID=7107 RepID=A0A835L7S6_SPOEX|nr:hypothetical protein HW555_001744 [Spodoptera exigua]
MPNQSAGLRPQGRCRCPSTLIHFSSYSTTVRGTRMIVLRDFRFPASAHLWSAALASYSLFARHTAESYGQSGMAAFREEAARGGVCVAREVALRAAPTPAAVDAALARLARGPQVAVCWCEGRTARRESLAANYTQEPKLALVVRGVYALAHALHGMRRAACGRAGRGLCAAMLPFNVSQYRRHLARVRFRAPDGGLVAFDDSGDPPPECVTLPPPAPGCRLCPPGHHPDRDRIGTCQYCFCAALNILDACWKDECTTCLASGVEWGDEGRGTRAVAAMTGAAGLAAVATCAVTFWRHRATPVVKSASRELCALLLCAAAVCHGAALAAVLRPGPGPCAVVRLAAPALGGVYAAVLARTVRVARLVSACERRPAARPRLLSSRAQLWTWLALTAPGACVAVWSAITWPATPQLLHPGRSRSVLVCGGEQAPAQLSPLAPALALLAACVGMAVRTRRLPHNFNETRFVGAAAYATCVTWLAFVPLYAVSAARTATLCACVSVSAGACVALSLGPRVWVCACRPARNTRAHFLTASIRCHVGKYRAALEAAGARDVACQAEGGARCQAAAACARVLRTEGEEGGGDTADVVIVLLQHQHWLPAGSAPAVADLLAM